MTHRSIAIVFLALVCPNLGQARVHSNTQIELPHNLFLADMNGDGRQEWIAFHGDKAFVARTNFQAHGMAYKKMIGKVGRAFAGRFVTKKHDHLCVITKKGIGCYKLSPDGDALWWTWTNSKFIGKHDEAIVGEFTGDGKDDVLVYKRKKGKFELWTHSKKKGFFVKLGSKDFDIGNLKDAKKFKNRLILAGNFGNTRGEGRRDDLLVYDPKTRQISVYGGRRNKQGKSTFWWAFTTKKKLVGKNESVRLANLRGGDFEDITLHNRKTGTLRTFKAKYKNGNLVPVSINKGNFKTEKNRYLFWGDFKLPIKGGKKDILSNLRDDALTYRRGDKQWHLLVARYSKKSKKQTYWWAYTQNPIRLKKDQDGDGIKTWHELGGYDPDNDGKSDEPLHEYGASPFVPDIFIEMDGMKSNTKKCKQKSSIQMSAAGINLAIDEMAAQGINLHVDTSTPEVPMQDFGSSKKDPMDWEDDFDPLKDKYFTPSRWPFFHYAIYGCRYWTKKGSGSSGRSRGIGGSDMIVTLGSWPVKANASVEYLKEAGTLIHELGHNLGLEHGGTEGENHKPNHLSVMNYNFQLGGVLRNNQPRAFYSEVICSDLDEDKLNENDGVKCLLPPGVTYKTDVGEKGAIFNDVPVNAPIDYNKSGKLGKSVELNINTKDSGCDDLEGGVNEYAILKFKEGLIGDDAPMGGDFAAPSPPTGKKASRKNRNKKRVARSKLMRHPKPTRTSSEPEMTEKDWEAVLKRGIKPLSQARLKRLSVKRSRRQVLVGKELRRGRARANSQIENAVKATRGTRVLSPQNLRNAR